MRVWQVKFEIHRSMPSMPYPDEVVEEVQTKPSYRLEGKTRNYFSGAQLAYTLSGTGGFDIDGKNYRLKPGTAFLALHYDPKHTYYYPPEETEPWHFLWISFFGKTLEQMVRDIVKRYGYLYQLPRDRGIIRRLEAYRNYTDTVQVLTPLAGAKLVMDTLTDLGKEPEKEEIATSQSSLVGRAQYMIIENLYRNINITELAEQLNVSREHFARLFKQQAGVSPSDYILKQKMKLACHLLKYSQLTIKEIADRTGYENPSSFIRAFKKIIHMSPGALRNTGWIPDTQ
jgi:AraC-like DNA-binding protein